MNKQVKQYSAQELFLIVPAPGGRLALRVTCKLCNEVVFDRKRDAADTEEVMAHGIKAHFEIQHQITLTTVRCSDPRCLEH